MALAPVAGLLLGAAGSAVAWAGAAAGLGPGVVAALVVAGWALATRGLHLDGLADTADGLAGGRTRAHALEVMRRGDVGPVGVSTLVLVLLIQVLALSQALSERGPIVCTVALTASRLALPISCVRPVPPARPDGLGAAVASSLPAPVPALLVLVAAGPAWVGLGPAGPIAILAGAATCVVALVVVVRRLGGVTGDTLGWSVELCLAAALVALSAGAG